MNDEPTRHFPKITDQALDALRARKNVRIENSAGTVVPRGNARQHPSLRAWHRRRQPAVVRSRVRARRPVSAASWRCRVSCSPPAASCRAMSAAFPGVHAMWAGADWAWHKPVFRNQEITTEAWLKDLIEHDTKFAGRAIQQIYHVNFFNPDGDLVAEADSWCFRTDRDQAREQGTKYTEVRGRPPRVYTEEDLAAPLQAL